jgi:hypothetical protein
LTFWRGFAVDAEFSDAFYGSIEGPQNGKNHVISIKFIDFSGGGSGPKHIAFCGACFSINPNRTLFGQKCQKSGPKNHEPSVFFIPKIGVKMIKKVRFMD